MTASEFARIRAELGLTQDALGAALGVTGRTVRRLEAAGPIAGPIARLMRALSEGKINRETLAHISN